MRLVDEAECDRHRGPGPCGYCGRPCRNRECAHIHSRGAGRVDIPGNLIGLGGPWECGCHLMHHAGKISREKLLEKAAAREGTTVEAIVAEVHRVRRLDKFGRERSRG